MHLPPSLSQLTRYSQLPDPAPSQGPSNTTKLERLAKQLAFAFHQHPWDTALDGPLPTLGGLAMTLQPWRETAPLRVGRGGGLTSVVHGKRTYFSEVYLSSISCSEHFQTSTSFLGLRNLPSMHSSFALIKESNLSLCQPPRARRITPVCSNFFSRRGSLQRK